MDHLFPNVYRIKCLNTVLFIAVVVLLCCFESLVSLIYPTMGVDRPVKFNAILCNSHLINDQSYFSGVECDKTLPHLNSTVIAGFTACGVADCLNPA